MKSQEVNFQKSQKLLASRAGSSKQTIARTAFTLPAIEIEWIAIECSEWAASVELAQSSLGEQFLRFSKNDLPWFNRIFFLFETRKSCVFQIFLLRSIKAYLCPNIINFDSVDFNERHPEEVISFFWRSVYTKPQAQNNCSRKCYNHLLSIKMHRHHYISLHIFCYA